MMLSPSARQRWQLAEYRKSTGNPCSVRLSDYVNEQITALSLRYGVSKNAVINDLLSDALNLLQDDYNKITDKGNLILL